MASNPTATIRREYAEPIRWDDWKNQTGSTLLPHLNKKPKQQLPQRGQIIAVRWKLKEGNTGKTQYFIAKVTKIDPSQKCFHVEYQGYAAETGDRFGMIHMDSNDLPWHTVDSKRSTSVERMKDVEEGDHLILHHLDGDEPPVLYEVIVEKIDRKAKCFHLFFEVFQESEEYKFSAMKKEVWHKIPSHLV